MSWNPFSSELTDNFKANLLFTPLALLIYHHLLKFNFNRFGLVTSFSLSVSFVGIYIYASRFYQPDLDHRTNRPGKAHFPFGKTISVFLMGNKGILGGLFAVLSHFQVACAKLWYWYWKPFTYLVTHRGATHIPIFGTFLRSLYVYGGIKVLIIIHVIVSGELLRWGNASSISFISHFLIALSRFPVEIILGPINNFFKSLCLFSGIDQYFAIYCLPVYLADIIHEAVDFYDSFRRGKGYCSTPPEEWGFLKKIFPGMPF